MRWFWALILILPVPVFFFLAIVAYSTDGALSVPPRAFALICFMLGVLLIAAAVREIDQS